MVLDALNSYAYDDDKQVVEVDIKKYYDDKPRIEVDFMMVGKNE